MSPLSPEPHKAFTPEQVSEWMSATEKKRLELYLLAAEPLYNSMTFPLCCFDQISCKFPKNTP